METFHTPMVTLNDGNLIPQIGLGVLRIDDEGVTPVVESALEAGYRHIDGAAGYLSLIHISEPTRHCSSSRMPSSA